MGGVPRLMRNEHVLCSAADGTEKDHVDFLEVLGSAHAEQRAERRRMRKCR